MQITFEKVSYSPSRVSIDGVRAVEDVSFELDKPGLTGIMGSHDSGRRTVLWLLAALLRPEGGHVLINGEDINGGKYKSRQMKACIGFVMHGAEKLLHERTVEREFSSVLRKSGLSSEEKSERMQYALGSVGIDPQAVLETAPAALSKCERYKISLALSLALKPDVLLLDEPMAQLDAQGRKALLRLFEKLTGEGCHILVATNDADFLAGHADKVVVMNNGRLIRSGSAKTVFADYYDLIRNNIPVPSVKKAAQLLRERDVNMPSNVVEYEQFIDRLKIIMWRKQR